MQTLATTTNMKQKSKKHDAAETADLVNFLKQFQLDLQNSDISQDAIEFLVLSQILRFAVLLALGIRPTMVFNARPYAKQFIQSPYSSTQTNVNGMTFLSQLQNGLTPTSCMSGKLCGTLGSLNTQYAQRIQTYQTWTEDTNFFEKVPSIVYPDFNLES